MVLFIIYMISIQIIRFNRFTSLAKIVRYGIPDSIRCKRRRSETARYTHDRAGQRFGKRLCAAVPFHKRHGELYVATSKRRLGWEAFIYIKKERKKERN